MGSFVLKNCFNRSNILVESEFIDQYMAKANGEYVKVYLLLLRHLNQPGCSLSISSMADTLENTEKDILRALNYWEREGLLTLEYDEEGIVSGLEMGKLSKPMPKSTTKTSADTSKTNIKTFEKRKELRQLIFVAEKYLGKTLTKTDVDMISFFYTDLDFSIDLTEYLIEYCVENGHTSFHYMKSVALAWAEEGITSVEQAKQASSMHSKNSYAVMNALGLKGRAITSSEQEFITRWFDEYGFTLDLVLEACNRTILKAHQPSFKYTESILKSWLIEGVKNKEDILVLDRKHEKEQAAKYNASSKNNNKFHNFEERSYDMDELERKLMNEN